MELKTIKEKGLMVSTTQPSLCEKSPSKVYYHYTSLDKMWKILSGEELWATQAGFSNDKEELLKGIGAISDIICNRAEWADDELKACVRKITLDALDSYIICFCDKDDKLSQWRAYCKDGGASLGFAFDETNIQFFYSDRKDDRMLPMQCQLIPVYYYPLNGDSSNKMALSKESLERKLKDLLPRMSDLYSKKEAILELIPYIKHIGFEEEEEHRWLIRNKRDSAFSHLEYKLDDVVCYNGESMPRPFVKVKFGCDKYPTNIKVICENENIYNCIAEAIRDKIVRYNNRRKTSLPVGIEYICSDNSSPQIIIGRNKLEVQKQLFYIVDGLNNSGKFGSSQIPIWCDGHLPIRSITVAPSVDQQRIIEVLKHQCEHKYFWMRYVTIKGSDIPYRSY